MLYEFFDEFFDELEEPFDEFFEELEVFFDEFFDELFLDELYDIPVSSFNLVHCLVCLLLMVLFTVLKF